MSVMAWSLTNEERSKVRDAFLRIDANNQGTITLLELKGVLTTEFHLEDERAAEIFKALDTAKNDEIHYSEFLAAMVSTRIHMHDHLLASTFKKFDADNSGYISLDREPQVRPRRFFRRRGGRQAGARGGQEQRRPDILRRVHQFFEGQTATRARSTQRPRARSSTGPRWSRVRPPQASLASRRRQETATLAMPRRSRRRWRPPPATRSRPRAGAAF
ncbi:unnamed protein product [Prorocentrum cordatum]|uniref:EF-hand domain-containing protein n=1 Tax=Prorocentrum cordatum TaxID=2364126 RepID=A0ABN9WZA5_9DINO|nr:unnamed protein product [Polarella glacialis]